MQSVDAIGTKRFDNKYTAHTVSILNLPAAIRNDEDHMLVVSISSSKFNKKNGGLERMIAGVDADGTRYNEISFCKELELLRDGGFSCEIPNDVDGGTETVELEVEYQGANADLLGLQQLSLLPDSFGATHPCKDCWFTPNCDCAHVVGDPDTCHFACCRGQGERTLEEQRANAKRLKTTKFRTIALREDAARDMGLSATKGTAVVEHTPGAHPIEDLLLDIMHIFFCGITPKELYQMVVKMVKLGHTTWALINARRKSVQAESGCHLSELVLPNTDGKKKKSLKFVINAATCMYWTVNRFVAPSSLPHLLPTALLTSLVFCAVLKCSSRC